MHWLGVRVIRVDASNDCSITYVHMHTHRVEIISVVGQDTNQRHIEPLLALTFAFNPSDEAISRMLKGEGPDALQSTGLLCSPLQWLVFLRGTTRCVALH